MNLSRRTIIVGTLALLFLSATSLVAFFDEVVSLKAELAQWEAVHADVDFSEVIEQLDDISGTVFTDTDDNAWYAPYVASLTEWGIVSGYKDASGRSTGQFGPGNQVTLAEVLKMAVEAADVDEATCPSPVAFTQANGHWSKQYVGCAERSGARVFVPSYGASLDRPAQRAEVLTIVHDLFGDQVPTVFAPYSDTVNNRFEGDIALASQQGIVSGDTDANGQPKNTFRPNDPINRAEASKIIYLKLKEETAQQVL